MLGTFVMLLWDILVQHMLMRSWALCEYFIYVYPFVRLQAKVFGRISKRMCNSEVHHLIAFLLKISSNASIC